MMLTNIPDFYVTLGLALAATIAWCAMVQYSRYVTNQKELKTARLTGETDAKNAVDTTVGGKFWFGYILIPLLFAVISAWAMMYVSDILSIRGYIHGDEEVVLVSMVGSVLIYAALDRWLVSNLGDAAFYKKVEEDVIDAFLETGNIPSAEKATIDPEIQRLIDGGFAKDEAEALKMIASRKK